MRSAKRLIYGLIVPLCLLGSAVALAASIPSDQMQSGSIFTGNPSNFETPAEVDLEAVITATPEYQEISRKKIERGTGRYWILMSQATDRAHAAVSAVSSETDYDLIAQTGYLGGLNPPIDCDDITDLVVEKVSD